MKIYVIMQLRAGAWHATSNVRLSHTRAVKLLAHLNSRFPGVRRRICAYGPTT